MRMFIVLSLRTAVVQSRTSGTARCGSVSHQAHTNCTGLRCLSELAIHRRSGGSGGRAPAD